MSTKHPWLKEHPISKDSKHLIIGTHPPMPYCGKLEYFYGNRSEFWRLLDKVYPNNNLYNNSCTTEKDITKFIEKISISITDMVYQTLSIKFSTDNGMGKVSFDDLNPYLKEWLENSKIEVIYFTSFGGTNSAKSLFKKWYKGTFNKSSKISNNHFNEIEIFDRKIKLIDLFSPSPTAHRSSPRIKEYQEWKINSSPDDYDSFRIHWYKTYLPKI
jgi:G:T/U-mismatch repair DNA glycosylase